MAERQIGGFKYEDVIRDRYKDQGIIVYTKEDKKKYTYEWDGIFQGKPISIKSESIGTDVEMADLFRNANKTQDFYLFVGFHDPEYNWIENYVMYIPVAWYRTLFCYDLLPYFRRLIKNITNDYADDERWKKGCALLRKYWKKYTPNIIRPRFKRDHKNQKRMQCAINNKDFYKYFLPYEVKLDAPGN